MYKGFAVPIVLGRGGLNGSDNQDAIGPLELIECNNVRFDSDLARKAGGFSLIDSNAISGSPTCLGGFDYWPDSSTQRQVTAWTNGSIYKEVSGDVDSVTLASGLTLTNPVTFLECGQEVAGNDRKLLMFHRGTAPRVLVADGSTANAISNPSVDWSGGNQPSSAIMHDSRVHAWGNANAPHAVYASTLTDHTDFLTGSPPIYDIVPGEGEYITACHSIGTNRLYIFKYPTGIYFIDTGALFGYTPVTTVRRDIGCAGPQAICKVGGAGTWFIGGDGHVYSLEMVSDPNVDLRDASITRARQLSVFLKDNIDFSRTYHMRLHYDPNRGEVWAIYTSLTGSSNDFVLIFDVRDPQNIKIAVENRGAYFNAIWNSKESTTYREVYVAGSGGLVYRANQDSRSIASSTAYLSSLRTPNSDFGWFNAKLIEQDKRLDWLELRFRAFGSTTIYIDIYVDGTYYTTKSIMLSTGGSTLDDTNVGLAPNTTKDDFILGGDSFTTRKIKAGGLGRRFSFRLYNQAANEDFGIASLIAYVNLLGTGGET